MIYLGIFVFWIACDGCSRGMMNSHGVTANATVEKDKNWMSI
jgi:hypothetical protein